MTSLQTLRAARGAESFFQELLSVYQANGFPVESWQPRGTERTRLMAIATAMSLLASPPTAEIAASGFLDYAKGDWLRLLSEQFYRLPGNPATFTKGDIVLTNSSAQSYTIAAGDLIAVFGSGRRYFNSEGGVLAGSSTLTLRFTAEAAGQAYSDASNSTALTLVTPLPGVTLTNPAGDYTDVAHIGAGTGTVVPGGSPDGPHSVRVRIDTSGRAGVASWSWSTDGQPYVSAGAVVSAAIGDGIVVELVDDPENSVSFVEEDTYLFATPGTWITQQGANIESDQSLAQRDRNRWSSLSSIPTNGFYQLLAVSVPDVGSQVTQVIVVPDAVVNNQVNIVVAGPLGALPLGTVATIQEWIAPRSMGTDTPVVTTPGTIAVTLGGTITCRGSLLQAAQSAIADALRAYVQGVGINGTVIVAQIIAKVMRVPGVVDIKDVTINGIADDLVLGSSASFYVASLGTLAFEYVAVRG